MKVKKTAEGWEIIPENSDEHRRLQWLIDSLRSHPDQQPSGSGSSDAFPMLDRNAESVHAQKAPLPDSISKEKCCDAHGRY